ncbi:DUF2614 family zinc ribbon-containing protein [Argonema galeatum]|uniref:DUF2614 family zinc ribbon-containing protein n=1 Tax=Argonema galeatum TaxID=2942762 RepID=UPI002010FF38|nr:DUF2614 family zinc ribbon-containing protein [Argonema galeatum]MCL1466163.1 hypothetical protein [Argonema galeatum A003/A1]
MLEADQDEMQKMGSIRTSQLNLSGFGCAITLLVMFWVLGAVGLGWLVKSFVILVILILMAPVIAFLAFRWWLQRNLVEDKCPVCGYQLTGLNQTEIRCPSCSEPLRMEQGHFSRITPPGTIDVQAVEVSAKQIED